MVLLQLPAYRQRLSIFPTYLEPLGDSVVSSRLLRAIVAFFSQYSPWMCMPLPWSPDKDGEPTRVIWQVIASTNGQNSNATRRVERVTVTSTHASLPRSCIIYGLRIPRAVSRSLLPWIWRELVSAVGWMYTRFIVHSEIKFETHRHSSDNQPPDSLPAEVKPLVKLIEAAQARHRRPWLVTRCSSRHCVASGFLVAAYTAAASPLTPVRPIRHQRRSRAHERQAHTRALNGCVGIWHRALHARDMSTNLSRRKKGEADVPAEAGAPRARPSQGGSERGGGAAGLKSENSDTIEPYGYSLTYSIVTPTHLVHLQCCCNLIITEVKEELYSVDKETSHIPMTPCSLLSIKTWSGKGADAQGKLYIDLRGKNTMRSHRKMKGWHSAERCRVRKGSMFFMGGYHTAGQDLGEKAPERTGKKGYGIVGPGSGSRWAWCSVRQGALMWKWGSKMWYHVVVQKLLAT
ncbi:hypothetical protein BJY52DRAFT_1420862 [Lactarius psammicola]|nr:hypothetical protein BJY52DRAFT_1420862 [Lactarius psammicola]